MTGHEIPTMPCTMFHSLNTLCNIQVGHNDQITLKTKICDSLSVPVDIDKKKLKFFKL